MKRDVIVINRDSNIAVVTLWARPDIILKQLSKEVKDRIGVIGTLYSRDGVNYVIESLAKIFTNIYVIIVFGPDLSGSGEALVKTFRGECGPWLRVPCEVVNRLGVKVIDLRDAWPSVAALADAILRNYKLERPREPIDVALASPPIPSGYPWSTGWGSMYDTSLFHLWVKLLDYVLTYGYAKPTEFGSMQLEASIVAQWGLFGKSPTFEEDFEKYVDTSLFRKYAEQIMDPTPPPEGVSYSYGHRLRGFIYGDQLEAVIRRLGNSPHTRRAVMVTWGPQDVESEDPPCVTVIQFLIHGEFLDVHAYIRSNDMFKAWPYNMYSVAHLAEYVAKSLAQRLGVDLKIGIVSTLSASAHIYDSDIELAKRVVEENWQKTWNRDVYDPRGNFAIIDNKLIHYTPDGALHREIVANRRLLKREAAKLVSDHAFYLGEEWAARELLGKDYEQEKWRTS